MSKKSQRRAFRRFFPHFTRLSRELRKLTREFPDVVLTSDQPFLIDTHGCIGLFEPGKILLMNPQDVTNEAILRHELKRARRMLIRDGCITSTREEVEMFSELVLDVVTAAYRGYSIDSQAAPKMRELGLLQ